MVEERTIDITERFLSGLGRSQEVSEWATQNSDLLESHLHGYDELSARINEIPSNSPLLESMPKVKRLKEVLGDNAIPSLDELSQGNFAHALLEARPPMLHGQKIKKGEIKEPTEKDISFAIGTPSMDTTPEALAVGTAGHLAERTFFHWARSKGLAPEEGWKKDDWLQALDEGLMLMIAEGESPP